MMKPIALLLVTLALAAAVAKRPDRRPLADPPQLLAADDAGAADGSTDDPDRSPTLPLPPPVEAIALASR